MGKSSRNKSKKKRKSSLFSGVAKTLIPQGRNELPPDGSSKLSLALGELIHPYVHEDMEIKAYRNLVTMGTMAWNMAVDPDHFSEKRLKRLLKKADVTDRDEFYGYLEVLSERKKNLFPEDTRVIVDAEARELTDGKFHLMVVSHAGL